LSECTTESPPSAKAAEVTRLAPMAVVRERLGYALFQTGSVARTPVQSPEVIGTAAGGSRAAKPSPGTAFAQKSGSIRARLENAFAITRTSCANSRLPHLLSKRYFKSRSSRIQWAHPVVPNFASTHADVNTITAWKNISTPGASTWTRSFVPIILPTNFFT